MTDRALGELSSHFDSLYARGGRRSIAPEKLLRALLLQALYSVPSERRLMEQIDHNMMYRWFVGLNLDDAIWDVTVFTKNRERLVEGEVAERLLLAVVEQAQARQLLSAEHFTVDGTLIQAWANRRCACWTGCADGARSGSRWAPTRRIKKSGSSTNCAGAR